MKMKGPWSTTNSYKYQYNSKENVTDLGLGLYDYGARWYDGGIAKFLEIDPSSHKYSWQSPFVYAINNPIRFIDKNGEGPGDRVLGAIAAVIDNFLGGNSPVRAIAAQYVGNSNDFNAGQDQGDRLSTVVGSAEVASGASVIEGSAGVTVASGGIAAAVTAPAAVLGLGMTAHGIVFAKAGSENLEKQKGRIKTQGSGEGRGENNRTPDSEASGNHSVSNSSGSTTFKKNDQNPAGWEEVSRTRTTGGSHGGVDPPYIKDKGKPTRTGEPNEIPTDLSKNKKL
ncbi:MAG: hypothetical protein IPP42_20645 [Saprospiraceae bacterium]|nr:hypothetical protein [Saprospiraceae bacterium]